MVNLTKNSAFGIAFNKVSITTLINGKQPLIRFVFYMLAALRKWEEKFLKEPSQVEPGNPGY